MKSLDKILCWFGFHDLRIDVMLYTAVLYKCKRKDCHYGIWSDKGKVTDKVR